MQKRVPKVTKPKSKPLPAPVEPVIPFARRCHVKGCRFEATATMAQYPVCTEHGRQEYAGLTFVTEPE